MGNVGRAQGPLTGVRVLELSGLGPGPYGGMLLADLGADVVRVDRVPSGGTDTTAPAVLGRGRRSVALDLKHPHGVETALALAGRADALIDPYRPGVTERLGIGPDVCLDRNPGLVYARMTGWGQEGPLAGTAGHDINYIALAGALYHFGRAGGPPVFPLNLVADFGGGGMLLAFGVVSGLLEARRSGAGQVIDVAMVDGVASLMTIFHELHARGEFDPERRGGNLHDSGAPYYDVYECADGEFVSVGPLEPEFYTELLVRLGLAGVGLPDRDDPASWRSLRVRLADTIRGRTRAEWCEVMEGSDSCFAPVLRLTEAPQHPHHVARSTFVDIDGVTQPAPVPRFTRTPGTVRGPAPTTGENTDEVLGEWLGLDPTSVADLRSRGGVA